MATIKVTTTFKLEGHTVSETEKSFNNAFQAFAYMQERKEDAKRTFPGMKFQDGSRGFVGKTERKSLIVKFSIEEDKPAEQQQVTITTIGVIRVRVIFIGGLAITEVSGVIATLPE